jgi:predicted DNA-binding transcriptional regulator YafY
LLFKNQVAPYVLSKPIHSSQISKNTTDGLLVRIEVIPNFELEQLILSFGESVQVVSPNALKENILSRIQNSLSNYLK